MMLLKSGSKKSLALQKLRKCGAICLHVPGTSSPTWNALAEIGETLFALSLVAFIGVAILYIVLVAGATLPESCYLPGCLALSLLWLHLTVQVRLEKKQSLDSHLKWLEYLRQAEPQKYIASSMTP